MANPERFPRARSPTGAPYYLMPMFSAAAVKRKSTAAILVNFNHIYAL
jgi:hypothetical protein